MNLTGVPSLSEDPDPILYIFVLKFQHFHLLLFIFVGGRLISEFVFRNCWNPVLFVCIFVTLTLSLSLKY
jgi:hypothetical protein